MEDTTRKADPLAYLVYVLGPVLYAASLLQTGYRVFCYHQAIQIPIVNLLNDPSLYPGDPYRDALLRYPSLLWHVVAWGARFLPLESLLLGGFLFERLLVIVAAGYAAHAIMPKSRLATVSAMVLFVLPISSLLGSGTIVIDYFEQTGLAIGFFLLAIGAFYESRPVFWAFCMAIGFNLHSMYGLFAMSYFAVAFLLDTSYRKAWRHWLLSFALFSVLALPAVLLSTQSAVGHVPTDNSLWMIASRVRSSRHDYPLTWPRMSFAQFVLIAALLLSLLWQQRNNLPKLFKHGVIWTAVVFLWLGLAFVVAYVVISPRFLLLQPARASDLWTCFAAMAIASILAARVEDAGSADQRSLAIILLGANFLLWQSMLSLYFIGLCLFASGVEPVWNYLAAKASPARVACLLTLCALAGSLNSFHERAEQGQPIMQRPPIAVESIASWASNNTPRDAVFLVDPRSEEWDIFRALSRRSVYTTDTEGGAINWDRGFTGEWVRRLALLGDDIRRQPRAGIDGFGKLRDENVQTVKASYRLDYWIVSADHPSHFPVAFESHGSKVLDLRPAGVDWKPRN